MLPYKPTSELPVIQTLHLRSSLYLCNNATLGSCSRRHICIYSLSLLPESLSLLIPLLSSSSSELEFELSLSPPLELSSLSLDFPSPETEVDESELEPSSESEGS